MAIIVISTSVELDSFLRGVLGTSSDTFNIAADIDMTGYFYVNGPFYSGFTGIFNGGGHTLRNFTINGNDDFTGVFPQLMGTLQNTTFQDISITNSSSNTNTGTGIAGFFGPGGVIRDVSVTGYSTITASCQRVGAVAGNVFGGQLAGTIQVGDAMQQVAVTGSQNNVGGLAGFWGDGILNCDAINFATVSSVNAEASFVGGIAGGVQSMPFVAGTRFENHGFIRGASYVGGLFGNYSATQDVVFDGSATHPANAIAVVSDGAVGVSPTGSNGMIFGGVFGNFSGIGAILQSYTHSALVTGTSIVGGVVGNLSGDCTLQNVVNTAVLDALSPALASLGGIAGHVANGVIRDATNIAPINVTEGGPNVGGIVGQVNSNGTAVLTGTFINGAPGTSATIRTASINTGGILGYINNGTTVAFDAYNYMDIITAPGTGLVGGIIGVIYGEAASRPNMLFTGNQLLYNAGQVTGGSNVGGIFGWITDNAIPGSIAPFVFSGGLVKQPDVVTIQNTGAIHSSTGTAGRFGGVMGALDAQNVIVRDYTNTVSVTGTQTVGGIIGRLDAGTLMGDLQNGNGSGNTITGEGNDIGGIIGLMFSGALTQAALLNRMNVSSSTTSEFVSGVIGRVLANAVIGSDVSMVNEGSISGGGSVGGIIGSLTTNQTLVFDGSGAGGTVHVLNQGTVLPVPGSTGAFFGGIFGDMDGTNATLQSIAYVFDVLGYRYVGALIGYLRSGTLRDSYNKGMVTAQLDAGGIVGLLESNGVVQRCYNTGTVQATIGAAGGVIGEQHGLAEDCYNLGTVSGARASGFVGTTIGGARIMNAYNAGLVTGSAPSAFVSSPDSATFVHTYYDSATSQSTDQTAKPLTTSQLIAGLPEGFVTSGAWLSGREGRLTYPYLAWQLNSGHSNSVDFVSILTALDTVIPNPGATTVTIDNISASFVFNTFGENFAPLPVGLSTVTATTTRPNQPISVGVMSESDIVAFYQAIAQTFTLSGMLQGLSPEQLAGLVVAYMTNDEPIQTVLVNADGSYLITDIPEGATVSVLPPRVAGFTVSPRFRTLNNIQSDITQQDFLYMRETTFTLSGTLHGLSPGQLTGLVVTYMINGGPTQTVLVNANGFYLITDIPAGATVSVFPPQVTGFTVSPESRTVNNIQSDIMQQDFLYMKKPLVCIPCCCACVPCCKCQYIRCGCQRKHMR